jgi:hypothetical protein
VSLPASFALLVLLIVLWRRRGLLDALVKIGRNEGVLAYWKGFAPYFLRLGNHTAFTFLFLEELKKLW